MKKLIIAAAAILISVSAFAQFGIVAGFTSTATDIKSTVFDVQSKNISLYHVGVTYKIGLGNVFAIQPSLIYNVKGAKFGELEGIKDVNFKTGFLELPVQIQIGFGLGKVARIYGLAEPYVGYAITNNSSVEKLFDDKWDFIKSRVEYGVGVGVGVELFTHLQVAARYFWNMGNLYGANPTVQGLSDTIKSSKPNGVMVSAAFLF